jgi:hypothetical protein
MIAQTVLARVISPATHPNDPNFAILTREETFVVHTKVKLSQTKIIKPFQLQRLERG